MSSVIHFSDAVSLALHSTLYLAGVWDKRVSVKELAEELNASSAHLSKVMARLTRMGLVFSVRGPAGGYQLSKAPEEISLLSVYEAIEGPLGAGQCPLSKRAGIARCPLTGFVSQVNQMAKEYFARASLADFHANSDCSVISERVNHNS